MYSVTNYSRSSQTGAPGRPSKSAPVLERIIHGRKPKYRVSQKFFHVMKIFILTQIQYRILILFTYVYSPLSSIQEFIRAGMLPSFILSSSACIIDHRFSIGFKSGELLGHTPSPSSLECAEKAKFVFLWRYGLEHHLA